MLEKKTLWHSTISSLIFIQISGWWHSEERYIVKFTCRLLRGSIFMTGPTVLRGSATSTLWFGTRGVGTWSGAAGARPKLQRRVFTKCKHTQKYKLHVLLNSWSYLFLLNCMAKSPMGFIALLVRVISIWMAPARRANVPDISRPLAFMAGSQIWPETRPDLLPILPLTQKHISSQFI